MTSVADLLQTPPDYARGVLIGLGDWKLSVEALLPTDSAGLWNSGVWGTDVWQEAEWVDLTDYVRGLSWTRGTDAPYGRPRVGDLTVTLNSDGDRWSPWNTSPPVGSAAYFAPGTIVRVGIRSNTDTRASGWIPQITAIVDTWSPTYLSGGLGRFVDFTAVETLRDLAGIDDNALGGLEGAGETAVDRIERLLSAAGWQYGLNVEAQHLLASPSSYLMVGTDMAQNRLAECYLVADSCDAVFRTDRTGAALLTNVEYVNVIGAADPQFLPLVDFSFLAGVPWIGLDWFTHAVGDIQYIAYDNESFVSMNTDDNIVNDARFQADGGNQQVYEQLYSIARFGRRTLVRTDLQCQSEAVVALLAQYATIRRGLTTLRIESATVSPIDRGEDAGLAVLAADVQSPCLAYSPDNLTSGTRVILRGHVGSLRHQVTPRTGSSLSWTVTFGIDTREITNLDGAQTPET